MTKELTVPEMIASLSRGKGAKFASVTYRNEKGELAKHTLIIGASTQSLYERDVAVLREMLLNPLLAPIDRAAVEHLLDSRLESLAKGIGNNSAYVHSEENADTFTHINELPGFKVHTGAANPALNGRLYINALSEGKIVIEKAPEDGKPARKRSPQTIARDAVRKALPSGRIRTLTLTRKKFSRCAVNGDVLEVVESED